MSKRNSGYYIFLVIIALSLFACNYLFSKSFVYPLPQSRLSTIPQYTVLDMSPVLTGMRRLGADLCWIQLLQYYGSPEKPLNKEVEYEISIDMTKYLFGLFKPEEEEGGEKPGEQHEHHHHHAQIEGGNYPELLNYCYRAVNQDPFFFYVYLYGAGSLAWNLNRTDEALSLLALGVQNMEKFRENITTDLHQPFWQLNLYISAIVYKKRGETDKMIPLIEMASRQKEAPNIVRVIMANIYEAQKKYDKALDIWISVYESKDPEYTKRAKEKIREIGKILNVNKDLLP